MEKTDARKRYTQMVLKQSLLAAEGEAGQQNYRKRGVRAGTAEQGDLLRTLQRLLCTAGEYRERAYRSV